MSDLMRIPFGQRESDGVLVDVHDTPNGRRCGCICPSCQTPLVARQGVEREWHFAHASKSVYTKTSNRCEYSAFVSIALMAKQLFMACPSVSLPAYDVTLNGRGRVTGKQHSVSTQVTGRSVVTLDRCEVEVDFEGVRWDVLGTVKGVPLAFYLVHPERQLPISQNDFNGCRIGALSIDLARVPELFLHVSGEVGGYKTILSKFLFDGCDGKRWVYHPRQIDKVSQVKAELDELCEEKGCKSIVRKPAVRLDSPILCSEFKEPVWYEVRYECLHCKGKQWTGPIAGGNICPSCGEHLYTRELGRVR